MKVEVAYITNRGKLRRRNEDSILVAGELLSGISLERPRFELLEGRESFLFAVADGMGGLPCGDVASRLTLEYLRDSQFSGKEEVVELLKRAKNHLDTYVEVHGRCYGMGTALAGFLLSPFSSIAFNVGDCRVYRKRGKIELLTRDHTEAYELYERGVIDMEGLRYHPLRNVLTSAIVVGYPEEFEVFSRELDVKKGDTFLVCSDGLWDELPEGSIERCMSLPVKEGSFCLFEGAYGGGRDNISFILFRVL